MTLDGAAWLAAAGCDTVKGGVAGSEVATGTKLNCGCVGSPGGGAAAMLTGRRGRLTGAGRALSALGGVWNSAEANALSARSSGRLSAGPNSLVGVGVVMELVDFHVFEHGDGVFAEDCQRAIERDEIAGDGVVVDAHQSY